MTATPVGTESTLVIAPMIAVLVAAVGTLLLGRHSRARAAVSLAGGAGYAIAVAAIDWYIILAPDAPGIATYQVGDWPAPFGITLVADGLSAFMLTMVAILGVASLVFSTRHLPGGEERSYYFPLFHFLALGVTGAFLTGDLFNLFVWFEVMLMASYVFVAYSGGPSTPAPRSGTSRSICWPARSFCWVSVASTRRRERSTWPISPSDSRSRRPTASSPCRSSACSACSCPCSRSRPASSPSSSGSRQPTGPRRPRSPRCWPARPKGRDLRHHPPLLYRVRRRGGRRQPPAPTGGRLHCGRLAAAVRRRGPVPHGQREHPPRRHRSRGP